jgi:hypothetical protein
MDPLCFGFRVTDKYQGHAVVSNQVSRRLFPGRVPDNRELQAY